MKYKQEIIIFVKHNILFQWGKKEMLPAFGFIC